MAFGGLRKSNFNLDVNPANQYMTYTTEKTSQGRGSPDPDTDYGYEEIPRSPKVKENLDSSPKGKNSEANPFLANQEKLIKHHLEQQPESGASLAHLQFANDYLQNKKLMAQLSEYNT